MVLMPMARRSASIERVGNSSEPLVQIIGSRRTAPAESSALRLRTARPGAASRSCGIGAAAPVRNGMRSLGSGPEMAKPPLGPPVIGLPFGVREKPRMVGARDSEAAKIAS